MRRYKFEAAADLSPEHLSLSLSLSGCYQCFFVVFFSLDYVKSLSLWLTTHQISPPWTAIVK